MSPYRTNARVEESEAESQSQNGFQWLRGGRSLALLGLMILQFVALMWSWNLLPWSFPTRPLPPPLGRSQPQRMMDRRSIGPVTCRSGAIYTVTYTQLEDGRSFHCAPANFEGPPLDLDTYVQSDGKSGIARKLTSSPDEDDLRNYLDAWFRENVE